MISYADPGPWSPKGDWTKESVEAGSFGVDLLKTPVFNPAPTPPSGWSIKMLASGKTIATNLQTGEEVVCQYIKPQMIDPMSHTEIEPLPAPEMMPGHTLVNGIWVVNEKKKKTGTDLSDNKYLNGDKPEAKPYASYILGTSAMIASPVAGVKLTGIETPVNNVFVCLVCWTELGEDELTVAHARGDQLCTTCFETKGFQREVFTREEMEGQWTRRWRIIWRWKNIEFFGDAGWHRCVRTSWRESKPAIQKLLRRERRSQRTKELRLFEYWIKKPEPSWGGEESRVPCWSKEPDLLHVLENKQTSW